MTTKFRVDYNDNGCIYKTRDYDTLEDAQSQHDAGVEYLSGVKIKGITITITKHQFEETVLKETNIEDVDNED